MSDEKTPGGEFWCPLGDQGRGRPATPTLEMTPADWAALSRFTSGEWVSDETIARLESLGLAERAFGQPLLTRLGRVTIGLEP